jgi:hypothetical protein
MEHAQSNSFKFPLISQSIIDHIKPDTKMQEIYLPESDFVNAKLSEFNDIRRYIKSAVDVLKEADTDPNFLQEVINTVNSKANSLYLDLQFDRKLA